MLTHGFLLVLKSVILVKVKSASSLVARRSGWDVSPSKGYPAVNLFQLPIGIPYLPVFLLELP